MTVSSSSRERLVKETVKVGEGFVVIDRHDDYVSVRIRFRNVGVSFDDNEDEEGVSYLYAREPGQSGYSRKRHGMTSLAWGGRELVEAGDGKTWKLLQRLSWMKVDRMTLEPVGMTALIGWIVPHQQDGL